MEPSLTSRRSARGFTLLELLVVIAILVLFGLIMIPAFPSRPKARIISCLSNLRQIGIAEAIWARDYNTNFPSLVSTNQKGTLEYLTTGRMDLHCQALATYMPSPTAFHCPADKNKATTNFADLTNSNISYFASLDAGISNFNLFMAGDRNLMAGGKTALRGPTLVTATTALEWSKEMHSQSGGHPRGNFLFPDGHVELVSPAKLSTIIASLGNSTNRLVFP